MRVSTLSLFLEANQIPIQGDAIKIKIHLTVFLDLPYLSLFVIYKQLIDTGDKRRKERRTEGTRRRAGSKHESSFSSPRFPTPLGLTALGYRFFASSPVRDPVTKSSSADALKYNPISPIGHGYGNSFKSSTPTGRSMPTVAERLVLAANNNCSSMPNSGRSTPVQTSSGRSTPTNLILSPTKSTMSNEELFAAIHKSKKRLNIKDDNENLSPYGSTNSLVKMTPGNRNSWSSEPQKSPTVCTRIRGCFCSF